MDLRIPPSDHEEEEQFGVNEDMRMEEEEESPEMDTTAVAVGTPPMQMRAHLFSTTMETATYPREEQESAAPNRTLEEQLLELCSRGPQSQAGDLMLFDPPRQLASARKLLEDGAQVEFQNAATGETALHVACGSGSYGVVKHLIQQAGANVRHVDHQQRNALHKVLEYHATFPEQPTHTVCHAPGEGRLPNPSCKICCKEVRTLTPWTPMVKPPFTWRVNKSLWIPPWPCWKTAPMRRYEVPNLKPRCMWHVGTT
uniref:Uncharacterized protein n=1 Tax=Amphora coffeiformis TaxID=265554 RepID=A0A7S3LA95_9STRA